MAIKLPVYERQVRATPVNAPQAQVVNASNAQGLAALGQGIQQAGAGIGYGMARQEALEAREAAKADGLRLDVVQQTLAETRRQLLEDPSTGFYSRNGEAAIKDSDSVKSTFQRYVEAQAKNLTPSQRAQLEPIALHEMSTLGHAVDSHVSKQADQLEQDTSKAIFAGRANDAVAAAVRGDMDAAEESIGAGLGHLDTLAERNGWTPEIKAEKERAYIASARQGMIESVLGAGDALRAAKMLEQYGPDLDQAALSDSKLRQRIDGARVKQQANGVAAIAWGLSGQSLADAEKRVNEAGIDDESRELAIVGVRKMAHAHDVAVRAADSERLGRIGEEIARARGRMTMAELDKHPDMLAMQTPEKRRVAVETLNAEWRRWHGGGTGQASQKKADEAAVQAVRARILDQADEKVEIDPSEYRDISLKARNNILTAVQAHNKRIEKGDAVKLGELSRMVQERSEKLSPNDKKLLKSSVQRWIEVNDNATTSDAMKFIDERVAAVTVNRWYGSTSMPRVRAEANKETIIPPKDTPALPADDIVLMRAPDGRALRVPRGKVADMEKLGARKLPNQ